MTDLPPLFADLMALAAKASNLIFRCAAARSTFIAGLAGAGLGVAFLPKTSAELGFSEAIKLVPLVESCPKWNLVMAWRRGAYFSPAAEAWLAKGGI
jgi:DNA-binding transcriptional LysR family regulator